MTETTTGSHKKIFRGFHQCENGKEIIAAADGSELHGEWIEGSGIHFPKSGDDKEHCEIKCLDEWIDVITETVGQSTGVCYTNGELAFEKDVILYQNDKDIVYGEIRYGIHDTMGVVHSNVGFYVYWLNECGGQNHCLPYDLVYWLNDASIKRIGKSGFAIGEYGYPVPPVLVKDEFKSQIMQKFCKVN